MAEFYDPARRAPNITRRPGNRRDDDWIRGLLARLQVCHIATHWDALTFINPTTFVYRPGTHDIVFHSNLAGRIRANSERAQDQAEGVCFEASEFGRLLPSNHPLELSMQYRSVIVFGTVRVLEGDEARLGLEDLTRKLFPKLRMGVELQPISDDDLARTSVYSISVAQWSGKENWAEMADQTPEWPSLPTVM